MRSRAEPVDDAKTGVVDLVVLGGAKSLVGNPVIAHPMGLEFPHPARKRRTGDARQGDSEGDAANEKTISDRHVGTCPIADREVPAELAGRQRRA